jgi:hypothetical protein
MSLARDWVAALRERSQAFAEEAKAVRAEFERHVAEAERFEQQVERNRRELAGYLVPDIDDETLAAIEARFHYPSLLAAKQPFVDAIAAAERDRGLLEADEAFVNRELTRIEAQGTLADIGPSLAGVRAAREPWEADPHHAKLRRLQFYDDRPPGGFFRALSVWRHGSLLMAALEKKQLPRFKDLDDLRGRWRALEDDFTPLAGAEASALQSLAAVDALETRHAELLAEPARQFKACFEALGQALVDHLLALPDDTRIAYAKRDPNLASFLKKDAGLKKQAAYLRELAQTRLAPMLASLEAEAKKSQQKANKVSAKLSRGKRVPVAVGDVIRTRAVPRDKWEKRRASSAKLRDRISDYRDYDQGSFLTTYLWWDTMTHGARADDLYEVRTFRQQHPEWSAASFVDPTAVGLDASEAYRDSAAAAFADQLMSEDPAEGLFDAS